MSDDFFSAHDRTLNLYTDCKECIFANFTNNIQTGCQLGRLDKFPKELIVDNGPKKYFKLTGLCNACRDKEWLEQRGNMNLALKEIAVQVDIVVSVNKDNLNGLQQTIDSIKNCTLAPSCVHFLVDHELRASQIFGTITQLRPLKFNVIQLLEPKTDRFELLEMAINRLNGQFVVMYKSGDIILPTYFEKVNSIINAECRKIALIDSDNSGLMLNVAIYKMVHTNINGTPTDAIKCLAKEQEKEEMILNYESDILNS